MPDEPEHPLTPHFQAALHMLIDEHGFQPPIFMAMVAANGSTLTGTFYGPDLTSEITSSHDVDGMYKMPINVMFVDSITGNAVRVTIEKPGQTTYTIN
jgi:hypothetical protein